MPSAIVAQRGAVLRIIDVMHDPNNQQSGSEPNGSDSSTVLPPHPDDLRNVMLGRPVAESQVLGSGEFSSPSKSDTEPEWAEATSSAEDTSVADWREHETSEPVPSSEPEYQRPPFYADSEIETDRGHPEAVARLGPPAGFGRRLIAYLVDNAIAFVILSLLFPALLGRPYFDFDQITEELDAAGQQVAMPTATPVLAGDDGATSGSSSSAINGEPQSWGDVFAGLVLALAVTTVYNGMLVGLMGTTVGKRLMNVYVLDANGNIPGIPLAFGRAFATILSTAIFYIGYLFILREDNRAMHDLMVGTYAITLTSDEQPVHQGEQQLD